MSTQDHFIGRRRRGVQLGRKAHRSGYLPRAGRLHIERLEDRLLLAMGANPLLPLDPAAEDADYLIIAAHDLYDPAWAIDENPVQRLADWKHIKGFKSYVLRLPAWQGGGNNFTEEDIQEYIATAYRTGTPTSYVLLVGDDGDAVPYNQKIPTFLYSNPDKWCFTDHPYACIEGDDNLAEVTLGRLPVHDVDDATHVIEKILRYDRDPDRPQPGQQDWVNWYDDALMAAILEDREMSMLPGSDPWDPPAYGEADWWFLETTAYVHDDLTENRGFRVRDAIIAHHDAYYPTDQNPEVYDENTRWYRRETPADFKHRISMFDAGGNIPDPIDYPDEYIIPSEHTSLWKDPDAPPEPGTGYLAWRTREKATAIIGAAIGNGDSQTVDEPGVGLVVHIDHGEVLKWVWPPFDKDDIDQLQNGVMTPVFFNFCCLTGAFMSSFAYESFAEMLLNHRDPQEGSGFGGAVGLIAATANTHNGAASDALTHGVFTSFWAEDEQPYDTWRLPEEIAANPYQPSMRPAEALNFGKFYMLWYAEQSSGAEPSNEVQCDAMSHHWLGDPEMMLRTDEPMPLDVRHDDVVFQGGTTDLTVTVHDPHGLPVEDARVCISKSGSTDYWAGNTGPDGTLTFDDMVIGQPGPYDIVVTAFNAVPYESTTDVLCWDGQGDGVWGDMSGGTSRWLDWGGRQTSTYPDGPLADAVVGTDAVTVDTDRTVRDLIVQSGSLTLVDDATLTVSRRLALAVGDGAQLTSHGQFQMDGDVEYLFQIGRDHNGLLEAAGGQDDDVTLAGTLALEAVEKLHAPSGNPPLQWFGFEDRTFVEASAEAEIVGPFDNLPNPQPEVYDLPGTGNWGQGHIGRGVFLTRHSHDDPVVHPGITYGGQATQVHLFQAADGDTNGDRYLNSLDIQAILSANTFPEVQPADWPQGDFNGDGWCNGLDIQAILATGLYPFLLGPYHGDGGDGRQSGGPHQGGIPQGGAPEQAAPDGGGREGTGLTDLIVTPDGLTVDTNGETLNGCVLTSQVGVFTGDPPNLLGFFHEDTDSQIGSAFFTLNGEHFLGDVIGEEHGGVDLYQDLTFTYTLAAQEGTFVGKLIVDPGEGARGTAGTPDGHASTVDLPALLNQVDSYTEDSAAGDTYTDDPLVYLFALYGEQE